MSFKSQININKMDENLVENKDIENDLLNENKDKNNSNHAMDSNETNDNFNDMKDEDRSQDLKISDLESECEKSCTSASNAGESEYESAVDQQRDDNKDLSQKQDECRVRQMQSIDTNVEMENIGVNDQVLNHTECEIKVDQLNEEYKVEPLLVLDKVESVKLESEVNPLKPKARRRRRYGRGPNKYTRQWQVENDCMKAKASHDHNRSLRHEDNEDNGRYDHSEGLVKGRADPNREYNDWDYDHDRPQRERKRNSRVRSDKNTRLDRSINEFSNRKVTQNNDNMFIEVKNNAEVVRTQTFVNSKYSQSRSSGNFEFENENRRRNRNRTNNESTGRAIRKTNDNLNYSKLNQYSSDNYRNTSNVRTEQSFQESNRTTERYYKEDSFDNQRHPNYVSDPIVSLQKLTIDEKLNRNNETEKPRSKRYSCLRRQQQLQRISPESIANTNSGPEVAQSGDSINAHQFYDSHQIQTPAYYT